MSIHDRDYLKRQIEGLAALVAALAGRPASVETKDAARECERLQATLLGPLRDGLDRLDPSSAVMLLGGAEKARLVARVLEIEGDLREQRGDAVGAARSRRQAGALLDAIAHQAKPR